jgi:hypothetical protein
MRNLRHFGKPQKAQLPPDKADVALLECGIDLAKGDGALVC